MSGKPAKRPKHIPLRKCVGCRMVLPKRTLLRLVRQSDGVYVDPTGKVAGRGAYLHNVRQCWENGLKGSLARALQVDLTSDDLARLRRFMLSLPEDNEVASD